MADEATSTSSSLPLAAATSLATAEPVAELTTKEAEATTGTISNGDVLLGKPEDATSAPTEDIRGMVILCFHFALILRLHLALKYELFS
jgi:hypothetical protein